MIRQDISNFKVGDLVRIKKGLIVGTKIRLVHNQTLTVLEDMIEGCGRVAQIVSFYTTDEVHVPKLKFETSDRCEYYHYDWSMLEELNYMGETSSEV